jgi:hypothetical protein
MARLDCDACSSIPKAKQPHHRRETAVNALLADGAACSGDLAPRRVRLEGATATPFE